MRTLTKKNGKSFGILNNIQEKYTAQDCTCLSCNACSVLVVLRPCLLCRMLSNASKNRRKMSLVKARNDSIWLLKAESSLSPCFHNILILQRETSAGDRRYNQKYPFVVVFNLQIEFLTCLAEQVFSVAARDIGSSARLMSSTRPISQSRAALFRPLTNSLNACTNKAWSESAIPLLRAEETTAV